MNGGPGRARRVVGRVRRELVDLRPPGRTLLRWLDVGRRGEVTFGQPGTRLDAQPPARVRVGDDVAIGDHVRFHLGPAGRVEIGAGSVLGPHVLVAADTLVRIGPGCRIGSYAVLVDTWSYGRTHTGPIPVPAPEPVVLGAGCRVGTRAIVGPGVELADGDTVAIGTVLHRAAVAP